MSFIRDMSSGYKSKDTPSYTIGDSRLYTAFIVATVLMLTTIGGALLLANTSAAQFILDMYQLFWLLGAVILSALLGLGWFLGLSGIENGNTGVAFLGAIITVVGYSLFGGAILTQYDVAIYFEAIALTSAVSIAITLFWSALIFLTDHNFGWTQSVSVGFFLLGFIGILVGSFATSLQVFAVVLILLGFVFDLAYEIWLTSRGQRSPIANGFAIYFAFAGVFFHLLQFALEMLADT